MNTQQWFLSRNSTTILKQEGNIYLTRSTQSGTCRSSRAIIFKINERTTTIKTSRNYTCQISISSTITRTLIITATRIYFLAVPYGPPLDHHTNKPTTKTQAYLTDWSKHMHQWLVNNIATSNSLDILYDDFKYDTILAEINGPYREKYGLARQPGY